ncbi:hypothetical protein PI125_g18930 [Phytophthora idaei]|nr:hypothetical protein PI125_g18930 [Phytophthora idaei]
MLQEAAPVALTKIPTVGVVVMDVEDGMHRVVDVSETATTQEERQRPRASYVQVITESVGEYVDRSGGTFTEGVSGVWPWHMVG